MEIMVSKMVMSCFYLDGGDDDYNDDERRGDVNFIPQNLYSFGFQTRKR